MPLFNGGAVRLDVAPSVDFLPIRSIRIIRWTRLEFHCATKYLLRRDLQTEQQLSQVLITVTLRFSVFKRAPLSRSSPPLYISLISVFPHVEMPVSAPPQPPTVSVTALCKAVNLAQQFTSPPTVCPYFWIC